LGSSTAIAMFWVYLVARRQPDEWRAVFRSFVRFIG
jgi:hypothetical protein